MVFKLNIISDKAILMRKSTALSLPFSKGSLLGQFGPTNTNRNDPVRVTLPKRTKASILLTTEPLVKRMANYG